MSARRLKFFRTEKPEAKRVRQWAMFLFLLVGVFCAGALSDVRGHTASAHFHIPWRRSLECAASLMVIFLIWDRLTAARRNQRLSIIQNERERLARELHDTVIQRCTGVSVLLEALASARDAGGTIQNELLDYAREQARQTIDDARNAVWHLRHTEKEIDLVAALNDLALQMTYNSGSAIEVRHNVSSLTVCATSGEEISMTVREAICNAAKHSGSQSILVDLHTDRRGLRVSVQDYGCGITAVPKADAAKHYGILGMHERMQRIGGGLQIEGMPGVGTTVELLLQWRSVHKTPVRI